MPKSFEPAIAISILALFLAGGSYLGQYIANNRAVAQHGILIFDEVDVFKQSLDYITDNKNSGDVTNEAIDAALAEGFIIIRKTEGFLAPDSAKFQIGQFLPSRDPADAPQLAPAGSNLPGAPQ